MGSIDERNRAIREKDAQKRREAARVAAQRLVSLTNPPPPLALSPTTQPTPPAPPPTPQATPQALHPSPVRPISVPVTPQAPPRPPQPQIMMSLAASRQAKPTQEALNVATGPGVLLLAGALDSEGDLVMHEAGGDVPHLLASGQRYCPPVSMMSVETPPIGLGEIDMDGC